MTYNSDEHDLFRAAMDDVIPLKTRNTTTWLKPSVPKSTRTKEWEVQLDNPLTTGALDILPLDTPLEYCAEGLQPAVLDKLRRGKYPPQLQLNLLRQTVEQCRQALYLFIQQAQQDNARNLLIIHGKGRDADAHANIIRSYLMRWLPQFEEVQAFCTAHPLDGGSGACYVALRKSDQARLDNRERHARRRL